MDNREYLRTALSILRDHPPGPDYADASTPDVRIASLLKPHDWTEQASLPPVLGREFQEALGAYVSMVRAHECLPHTVLAADPYGPVDAAKLRRLLIDAADVALALLTK